MNTSTIEFILNLFPEVTWDRWAGDAEAMGVFGWIPRTDGKSDFVFLRITNGELRSVATSSAEHSPIFADRFHVKHHACKRVEHCFPGSKSIHLKP